MIISIINFKYILHVLYFKGDLQHASYDEQEIPHDFIALFVMIFAISGCGNAGSSSDSSAKPPSSTKEEVKMSSDVFKDKTFSIFEDWGSGSYGIYYETG
ncbi:hypothetical protein [Paenibacillus polymyxa]|uniref:hypothetical protein n=1 Tax=Paenibacillus polymyxa TaxID=1406 RepID=UPI00237991C1|nr:hypothetical protein [Paenibacillus polymyxa]